MRPIDANALYTPRNVRKVTEYDETGCGIDYLAVPWEVIKSAPTLDYAPVRHGEWIPLEEPQWNCFGLVTIGYRCSECGREEPYNNEPYCHCGAKMQKGDA